MGSLTHDEKKQTHYVQKQLASTKHENNKNIAFSRQLTEQTQIEKKNRYKEKKSTQSVGDVKWNMTRNNVQLNVTNYLTPFTAQAVLSEGSKRHRGIKKWAHRMILLWFTIPAAPGFRGIAQSEALYIARHPKQVSGFAKVTFQIESEVQVAVKVVINHYNVALSATIFRFQT